MAAYACPTEGCGKSYVRKDSLVVHIKRIHQGLKFNCTEEGCGKSYASKDKLTCHNQFIHLGHKFNCTEEGCGKSYASKDRLASHNQSIHLGHKFSCTEEGCGKSYAWKNQLASHNKYIHQGCKFNCTKEGCRKSYSRKETLIAHIKRIHQGRKFNCTEEGCGKSYGWKSSLNQHIEKDHLGLKSQRFNCTEEGCGKSFVTKSVRDQHMGRMHLSIPRSLLCTEGCDKTFTWKSGLYKHIRSVHRRIRKHTCPHSGCHKTFETPCRMRDHLQFHRNGGYTCPFAGCNHLFLSQPGMIRHVRTIHEGKKRPRPRKSQLLDRYAVEHQIGVGDNTKTTNPDKNARLKPGLVCGFCGKACLDKGLLDAHVRGIHADTQRVTCGICGLSVNRKGLTLHIIRHTGNPYTWRSTSGLLTRNESRNIHNPRPMGPPFDIEYVKKMARSGPFKFRRIGGVFKRGPLKGQEHSGLPAAFTKHGHFTTTYRWLRHDVLLNRVVPRVHSAGSVGRPQRQTALLARVRMRSETIPEPVENRKWADVVDGAAQFTEIRTNLYTPGKWPGWQAPADWRWSWPTDPTCILDAEVLCGLCGTGGVCDCYGNIATRQVQRARRLNIIDCGPTIGQGIQASRLYKVGDYLGEFVGELAPLGSFRNGYVITLTRTDLKTKGKAVEVYDINPLHCGNWARKLNHSCDPNVAFRSMPISGKWRVMIQAVKGIGVGDDVLVSYGESYWRGHSIECACGSENCVSKKGKRKRKRSVSQDDVDE